MSDDEFWLAAVAVGLSLDPQLIESMGQGNTMVIILRDGQPTRVPVTSAGSQGEWTIVRSNELQAGDEAVGSVSSFLNQGDASGGFGPPGGGPGFGGAVRGAGGGRPQ